MNSHAYNAHYYRDNRWRLGARKTKCRPKETTPDLSDYAKTKLAARRRDYARGVREKDIPPPLRAGHCDLCEKPTVKLFWDHDHVLESTGVPKVHTHRGWLCFHCNTGLGKLGDTPEALLRAYCYVKRKLR